jgi:hypothetical protein
MAPNPVIARVIQDLRSVRMTTTDGGSDGRGDESLGCNGQLSLLPTGTSGHLLLLRFILSFLSWVGESSGHLLTDS